LGIADERTGMNNMNEDIIDRELNDEIVLTFDVSDETLEASANLTTAATRMSAASTAVILILCCVNG
jgi:hypothetical protein